MNEQTPRVSLGLPVFNGERFLSATLDSLIGQTYSNFELIISDNGSTDMTSKICQEYASSDKRIRYFRHEFNRGATWNYNNTFRLSRGELFKWCADDDTCESDYISQCIKVLDEHTDVPLVFTYTPHIGIEDNLIGNEAFVAKLDSPLAYIRLRNLICGGHDCRPIFGLIRSRCLNRTRLIRGFDPGDIPLVAELILQGPFIEIPIVLQYRRIHPKDSDRCFDDRRHERNDHWYVTNPTHHVRFPWWRLLGDYGSTIQKATLSPKDKILCYVELARWIRWGHGKILMQDLRVQVNRFFSNGF